MKRFLLLSTVIMGLLLLSLPGSIARARPLAAVDCNASGIVCKSGTLSGSETWTSGNVYYLDGNVTVPNGATLTIQAGTVVKLGQRDELIVDGTLNVNGTSGNKVYFTSLQDDSVGGDTNGNGASDEPSAGNWERVYFRSGSSGTINYAEFRYGGDQGILQGGYGAIHMEGASPTISNVIVRYSDWAAISGLISDQPIITNFEAYNTLYGGFELRNDGAANGNYEWDQDIVYIITNDLTIPNEATIDVGAGTVVKLGHRDELIVDGTLNVNGISSNKVYFTSLRDDGVGGDTNGNGASDEPSAGNWERVYFRSGSSGTINHAEFRYGGDQFSSPNYGAIHMEGASPTISNVIVRYSDWSAISGLISDQPTITNFEAYNTPYGGFELRNDSAANGNYEWDQDIVYILAWDITIPNGATVTIDAGTVVKFRNATNIDLIVDGTLNVNGISSNKVYFTSLRDDGVGGDTNGNGASDEPSAGNWDRIYFRSGSNGTINYAEFRYGGDNGRDYGTVHIEDTSPTISNAIFYESDYAAIKVYANNGTASPIITNCELYNNRYGLYNTSNSGSTANPSINNCDIYNNSNYGVYNATTTVIDATNNWWGSDGGPNDPSNADSIVNDNPSGDEVSDYVDYSPWKTKTEPTPTHTPSNTPTQTPTSVPTNIPTQTPQATASGTPAPTPTSSPKIYLPLVVKAPPPSLSNGNFEQGSTGWTQSSARGANLIYNDNDLSAITARSGQWLAWLGGVDNEISYIRQQVTVPSNAPYLSYWHWIASEDVCGYDFGGVGVDGSWHEKYDLCTNTETNGWVLHTVDMMAYAGQTITIDIAATTDGSNNSNLFVDDVAFRSSRITAHEAEPPQYNPTIDVTQAKDGADVPVVADAEEKGPPIDSSRYTD